jgi:hypothetical protein
MKRLMLSIVMILGIIGTIGFIYADNFNINYSVKVHEGWNLLQGFASTDFITNGDISTQDISAIFVYLPEQNKYARVYPNPELKIDDEKLLNSAFWVYSKKDGILGYHVEEEWAFVNGRILMKGWNFIGITPDMKGKSVNDIKGNCIYEKVAYYEASQQAWSPVFKVGSPDLDEKVDLTALGLGFLIKVPNACTLSTGTSVANPPQIPI